MLANQKILSKLNKYKLAACPTATKDVATNLKNRQKCIDDANYGPLNPNEPNEDYWKAKADMFGGINDVNEWDTIDAGDLGYCEAFDFKCAANRTCDAWVVGGPIVD